MPPPVVAEHLRRITAALRPLGIRWYVFGAQAVIAAGAVRQTADLDITTEDVPVAVLQAALRKAGFHLRDDIPGLADLVEHHRVLPLQHRRSGFQLDVIRAGPGLEEELLTRAIRRRVGRVLVPFVSTDDLLVLKTLAGRDKDLEDVRALLRGDSPEVHLPVVRARLERLGAALDDGTLRPLFEAQVRAARPARRRRRPDR